MRKNLPVTQIEYTLADDDLLISRTNLKGQITYANPAFVRVSGFTLDELIGAHHNLVRHPDMPPAAFKNFWDTIQRGGVWTGLVKNRCKNGDYYWVRANVVALKENGQVVGYASLRVKPTTHEVSQAETLYREWREGRGKRYTLHQGQIRRRGMVALFGRIPWRSTSFQTRLLTLLASLSLVGLMVNQWQLGSAPLPLLAGSLSLLVVAGLGIGVGTRVSRAIDTSRRFVLQVAAGNLTVELPAHGNDDIGKLVEALATMKKGLNGIVGDVNSGIDQVRPSVASIRQNNETITRHGDALATSVQETAASTEQLMTTVQQNADNAQQASHLALSNVSEVRNAGDGMSQVVQRMAAITESARRMTETVTLIDSIAFQTNILALNASVEAARAGEHGRGFAVVASEVRALANRSSEAAKEIHQLINATNAEIDAGGKVVQDTESAIAQVIEASGRVNDIMEEISAASREQSSGISQIGSAVNQMDEGVQHTATQLQSSYATTQSLEAETTQLVNAIRAFRTRPEGRELTAEVEIDRADATQHPALPNAGRGRQGERPSSAGRSLQTEAQWQDF